MCSVAGDEPDRVDAVAGILDENGSFELGPGGDERPGFHCASTSPFFEARTLDSSIAGETARALVSPRMSVALYCDGDLSGVFPCEIGDVTVSVTDFVSTLAQLSDGQRIVAES